MIVRELSRATTSEMMLEEFTVERLEEPHGRIHLMSDIRTVRILFDEFCDFFQSSFRFADTGLELGLVWSHTDMAKIY
jgi:hypothetical protein